MGQNFFSHDLNMLVTDLNNNKQVQFEEYALKSNARAFTRQSRVKTKPQRRISAWSSTRTVLISERYWTDNEVQDGIVH